MNIAALIVIDVQKGFDDPRWGSRNNPDAEANIAQLLSAWRSAELPVIHIQHHSTKTDSPLRPGTVGSEFKPEAIATVRNGLRAVAQCLLDRCPLWRLQSSAS